MRRRWFAIPVVLIMIALAACGPEDKPSNPAKPATDLIALAKKFAPLVRLGEGEKYKPIDALIFIDNSALMWNREKCPDQKVDDDPTAQKLADPGELQGPEDAGQDRLSGQGGPGIQHHRTDPALRQRGTRRRGLLPRRRQRHPR